MGQCGPHDSPRLIERKISNLGKDLISKFEDDSPIYKIIKEIIKKNQLKIIKYYSQKISLNSIKKNGQIFNLFTIEEEIENKKPVTVYSFQLVSEDNQTFEECNYFKELDCCILEKDAKLLNLFSTMTHESILSNGTSLSNFENRKIIKKEYFLNYLNEINLLKKYVVDIDMELQKLEN